MRNSSLVSALTDGGGRSTPVGDDIEYYRSMIAGLQREVDHLQSKHESCVNLLRDLIRRMDCIAIQRAPTQDEFQRLRNLTAVALIAIERLYCPQCAE